MLLRLAAFTENPEHGNPAGVWIGDALPAPDEMLRIAAEVGYSETAFIAPATGSRRTMRYYSPKAEVTFCGHATIASGVALGDLHGAGTFVFDTAAGEVSVDVRHADGRFEASLTSVAPQQKPPSSQLLDDVLGALRWVRNDVNMAIPPALAYAGAWHFVIAAATRDRLDRLDYDYPRLESLMVAANLTTIQLIWCDPEGLVHSRNPFPVGGVVEDPATGAAAAALGGYLRDAALIQVPAAFRILQGEAMGRPSHILVEVPVSGGVKVTGTAVRIV